MQNCNVSNLPENYPMKYYFYHFLSWPQLLHVAEADDMKTTGYVLSKMNEESDALCHGHITSLAVVRTQRKQGIAHRLMDAAHDAMQTTFNAEFSSLHVRISNRAASSLYASLGYRYHELESVYYSDGEDALGLRRLFPFGEKQQALRLQAKQQRKNPDAQRLASASSQSSSLCSAGPPAASTKEALPPSSTSSTKSKKSKRKN